jgi:hypothetical protein
MPFVTTRYLTSVAEVIVDDLVKNLLGDLHLRRLALHDQDGFTGPVVHQDVSPPQHRMEAEELLQPVSAREDSQAIRSGS